MTRLPVLSGDDRIKALEKLGYQVARDVPPFYDIILGIVFGGHVKLQQPSKTKQVESLTGLINTSVIDLLNMISPKGQKRAE